MMPSHAIFLVLVVAALLSVSHAAGSGFLRDIPKDLQIGPHELPDLDVRLNRERLDAAKALSAAKEQLHEVMGAKHAASNAFAKNSKLQWELEARIAALEAKAAEAAAEAAADKAADAAAADAGKAASAGAGHAPPKDERGPQIKSHSDVRMGPPAHAPLPAGPPSPCGECDEELTLAYQRCAVEHGDPCKKRKGVVKDAPCCQQKEQHQTCNKCAQGGCAAACSAQHIASKFPQWCSCKAPSFINQRYNSVRTSTPQE